MSILGNHGALISAILLSVIFTLALKTMPITFLQGETMPIKLKNWLDFVPVAVMAALVGPDIFIYNGKFDLSTSNLFFMVSIPTFIVAWFGKNYFLTIAFGIGLVILARHFGFA